MRVAFEILEHPADVGFVAYGATLEELFANAALAMSSLACEFDGVAEREEHRVEASGATLESLLYAWLTEILAVADAGQLVFRRFGVTRMVEPREGVPGEVEGLARGEKYDRMRHLAGTYIKAVTYHQFRVEQTPGGWRAQVFLDV